MMKNDVFLAAKRLYDFMSACPPCPDRADVILALGSHDLRVPDHAASLYLAGAGMAFLMTVIITVNHFFINYSTRGSLKNMILNRIALLFKLAVYILLFAANSCLDFQAAELWKNGMQYMTDLLLLLLLVSVESQFDSFNALREELRRDKRAGRAGK